MSNGRQRPKIRVLLADDHILIVEGVKALIEDTFDLVAVVHDGRALVEAAKRHRPDVVVTDMSMPLMNGLEAIRQIIAFDPRLKIVVLTMHRDIQLASDAFRAGACGYLLKVSPGEELIAAITDAARGRSYVTSLLGRDAIALKLATASSGKADGSPLTGRQREVLQLVAEGKTMKEVASILDISPRTAESHKYEIMQVLGLQTTAELVQYAMKSKLLAE